MRIISVLAFLALSSGSVTASPLVFDFANLQHHSSVYSGFLPTDGISCFGHGLCSSDAPSTYGGDLTFINSGLTVHALGSYDGGAFGSGAAVVQDRDNAYNGLLSGINAIGAGLGIYHRDIGDNISSRETLWLHFDQEVSLTSIGLRSQAHNTTSWGSGATFQYSFDNAVWITGLLPLNVGQFGLAHTGTDFYFRFGGPAIHSDQFYLSSVTVSAVPEPETYAMLMAGLSLIGFSLRNQKNNKTTSTSFPS